MAETLMINGSAVDKRNDLNDLTSKEWIQETKSFFYQKGLGAGSPEAKYEKMHPAPFSFTDITKLIRFFTKHKAKVLDPFVGVGSTIKACVELDREGFGVELSPKWCEITRQRLAAESNHELDDEHLVCGDSRKLKQYFKKETFDFIVTSPPYWNILEKKDHKANERVINGHDTKYSESKSDLGNIEDYNKFLDDLAKIFLSCHDLLKPGKYMCIIVSDFRHKSEFYPFHSDLLSKLTDKKQKKFFQLKGIKVLIQNAKKLFPYGYPFSYVENIHHQYVLILQKQK
ncbi:TRM11 family SAM-dependent methyltransferase [Parasediminibacterium paludis]|uniref:Methyltransferase n=1 Tax=Parasediminibacterium paludis TaxID=908966 RepID=A0ABV8PX96_9BACT